MRSAGNLVMSRPSNSTRPELTGRSPDNRLMSVVLPAPFGPMMAWTWPISQASDTSLTAASPPKWRDNPRVCRIASVIDRTPSQQAGDAVRQIQRHQHDGGAHRQLPVLAQIDVAHYVQRLQSEFQQQYRPRTDDGSCQRTHAAEDHHHQHRPGKMPAEHVRIDHTELHRPEIPRQAR